MMTESFDLPSHSRIDGSASFRQPPFRLPFCKITYSKYPPIQYLFYTQTARFVLCSANNQQKTSWCCSQRCDDTRGQLRKRITQRVHATSPRNTLKHTNKYNIFHRDWKATASTSTCTLPDNAQKEIDDNPFWYPTNVNIYARCGRTQRAESVGVHTRCVHLRSPDCYTTSSSCPASTFKSITTKGNNIMYHLKLFKKTLECVKKTTKNKRKRRSLQLCTSK